MPHYRGILLIIGINSIQFLFHLTKTSLCYDGRNPHFMFGFLLSLPSTMNTVRTRELSEKKKYLSYHHLKLEQARFYRS